MNAQPVALLAAMCINAGAALAGPTPAVVITEWMYSGGTPAGGEFFELTNIGEQPIDLTGWSFDDSGREPGAFDLSTLGIVGPGESVIITQDVAGDFRTEWDLQPLVKVVGELGVTTGSNLGRNDEINVFDPSGTLVDRLTYGDEDFPGTIRTQGFSGSPASADALGANDVTQWTLASVGDGQQSWTSASGDLGNPGSFEIPGSGPIPGPVTVSHASGFYTGPIGLSLEATGGSVYYTLDGSVPSISSNLYSGTIQIDDRTPQPNVLSLIPTSPYFTLPAGAVFKATVVRAAAINADGLSGPMVTRSFIVHPDGPTRFTLPVVSLVTERDNLFGYERGIYVPGAIYDQMFDPSVSWWNRPGNYTQSGDDWERPARIEFFEPDGSLGFAMDVGIRIHGGASRAYRRKSVRVYARGEYGESSIEYPLFPGDTLNEFKRLILRNSGNDYERTMFRDAFIQDLVKNTGIATQLFRPVIVLINGEYWGIHNIRERHDKHFLEMREGVDPDNIDLLSGPSLEIEEGDRDHFLAAYDYILNNDLADAGHYAHAQTLFDVEDLITYYAIQMFIVNTDWPQNNIKFWRPRTPEGKWRWLLYDTDLSFNHGGPQSPSSNSVSRVLADLSTRHARTFQRFASNDDFARAFLNRSADLMNSALSRDVMSGRLAEFRDLYAPEIPEHLARWRVPADFAAWNNTMVGRMQTFISQRADFHRQHLADAFELSGVATVTIVRPDPSLGELSVNSIDLPTGQPQWTGVYFNQVPVSIRGDAADGYRFLGFEELPGTPNDGEVIWIPEGDQTLTARFVCEADFNADGNLTFFDVSAYLNAYAASDPVADLAAPFGAFNFFDVAAFVQAFSAGCP